MSKIKIEIMTIMLTLMLNIITAACNNNNINDMNYMTHMIYKNNNNNNIILRNKITRLIWLFVLILPIIIFILIIKI